MRIELEIAIRVVLFQNFLFLGFVSQIATMAGILELPFNILEGLWEVVRNTPGYVLLAVLVGAVGVGLGCVSFFSLTFCLRTYEWARWRIEARSKLQFLMACGTRGFCI